MLPDLAQYAQQQQGRPRHVHPPHTRVLVFICFLLLLVGSTCSSGEELVGVGQKTLLLTVAMNTLGSQTNVMVNLLALKGIADIGVMVITDPEASDPNATLTALTEWEGVRSLAKTTGVVFRIRAPPMPPFRRTFVTKLYFHMRARDWIALYDYVWLADVDILFHRFDYAQFWLSHQSAFPDGPPLIAGALIRQNTQRPVVASNMNMWSQALGTNATQYVATTMYLEQGAPFFNAKFLLWLLARLEAVLVKQLKEGSDSGPDTLWCGGAKHYIHNVANNTKHANRTNRTSCGLVLVPIDHLDTKTINNDPVFDKARTSLLHFIQRENPYRQEWDGWEKSRTSSYKFIKLGGVVYRASDGSDGHLVEGGGRRWEIDKNDTGDCYIKIETDPTAAPGQSSTAQDSSSTAAQQSSSRAEEQHSRTAEYQHHKNSRAAAKLRSQAKARQSMSRAAALGTTYLKSKSFKYF
jgi:hypothetical protein